MGWISKRHMRSGGSIGPGGLGPEKKGAPLKRVMQTIRPSRSLFEAALVLLECGHEAASWGGVRARCGKCRGCAAETEQPPARFPVRFHCRVCDEDHIICAGCLAVMHTERGSVHEDAVVAILRDRLRALGVGS